MQFSCAQLKAADGRGTIPANAGYYFDWDLSNVQIYNTSFSANEVNTLYLEGIGGAPIDPTHIVGRWSPQWQRAGLLRK